MDDIDYIELQRRYGGLFIARRGMDVIASAETYDELSDMLDGMTIDWTEVAIEFVPRSDVVYVY
jgi:hypothetical protein